MKKYSYLIPNYDLLKKLIQENPLPKSIKRRRVEFVLGFLTCRTMNHLQSKKVKCINQQLLRLYRIELSSQKLRELIHNFEEYTQYLKEIGLLFITSGYQNGVECKRYWLAEPIFNFASYKWITITCKNDEYLFKKLSKCYKKRANAKQAKSKKLDGRNTTHTHLKKSLKRIKIDLKAVHTFISSNSLTSFQMYRCHYSSRKIADKDFKITINKHGRIYSIFGNAPSCLRQFISIDGESLVSMDFCNSQPLVLSFFIKELLLLMPGYNLTSNHLPKGIRTSSAVYRNYFLGYKSAKFKKSDIYKYNDLHDYMDKAASGELYEHLAGLANEYIYEAENRTKNAEINRKSTKKCFMKYLFGNNPEIAQNTEKGDGRLKNVQLIQKIMLKHYPTVNKLIAFHKRDNYKNISWQLARMESSIVINKICPQLAQKGITVLTIHDCFYVKKSDLIRLKAIVLDTFFNLQQPVAIKIIDGNHEGKIYMNANGAVIEQSGWDGKYKTFGYNNFNEYFEWENWDELCNYAGKKSRKEDWLPEHITLAF